MVLPRIAGSSNGTAAALAVANPMKRVTAVGGAEEWSFPPLSGLIARCLP
jgi:hypothetical protein